MNDILSKVVEELKSEKPNIDYIRGMLETLLAMQPEKITFAAPAHIPDVPPRSVEIEGIPMPGNIAKIAQIAKDSSHE